MSAIKKVKPKTIISRISKNLYGTPWRADRYVVSGQHLVSRQLPQGRSDIICKLEPAYDIRPFADLLAAAPELQEQLIIALSELDKIWVGLENPTAQKWWMESKTRAEIVAALIKAGAV